jgi:hypothetical protein
MRRLLAVAVLLAVSLLVAGTGCYTVLRHPTGSDIVQEGSYYRGCSDCHADAAFYHPYGGSPYYNYGQSNYGWGGYYGRPWWYDDYWGWGNDHGDHGYEGPDVETGQRHLWSPDGWAPQGWGFSRPESGTRMTPSTPPPEQPRDEDKKKDEPKKEEKKTTEDKDTRSIWDTPKRGN